MKRVMTASSRMIGDLNLDEERAARKIGPIGGSSKRIFDVLIAATAILVLLPLMVIVAILVWRHDKESPFFAHRRIGLGGRPFRCFKFRSMVKNSSDVLDALIRSDEHASRQWKEGQKLRDDPRITPIGRIIRASSVDELPQLFNVLRGDMSMVGPRPIVSDEIERYGSNFSQYCACRPGLTGLWQVNGRSDCNYNDRVRFDIAYASQWSIWLDTFIMARTIPVIIGRKGSY